MPLSFRSSWFLCCLVLPGLSGCGSSDPPPVTPVPSACANETRGDAYAPGLQKSGPELSVTLLGSEPGPPAMGVNSWDIQVRDAAGLGGGVRNDLAITALPWMPDHNHGTSVKASVTPTGMDGRYMVTPLYLYMAGLWQITLTMQAPAATMDTAVFKFCIDDN
jgi:hypothetical protein